MTVRVVSPRKSNFTRPAASTSSLANWVMRTFSPGRWYTGTKSHSGRSAITTPAACIPAWRWSPSRAMAICSTSREVTSRPSSRVPRTVGFSIISRRRGSISIASLRVMLRTSGTSLAIRSPSEKGSPKTRATSRSTLLAFSEPKVMICPTLFWPYLPET